MGNIFSTWLTDMAQSLSALDLIIIFVFLYIFKQAFAPRPKAALPPGPRGLPWVGNVLQWPADKQWETYARWGREHGMPSISDSILYRLNPCIGSGDIVYLKLFGRPFVVVNSAKVAFEMLDRKGALYSDRPIRPMLELSTIDQAVVQVPYGDRHRKLRTLILKALGTKATVSGFATVFEENWNRFLRRIVEDPSQLREHIRT